MRVFPGAFIFTPIVGSIVSLGLFLGAQAASANEVGAYRPGLPYHSLQASSSDICASQCSGDAQCRSWNFVRIKTNQGGGICEFNNKVTAPIASPHSVSGLNSGIRQSARLISAGTRTVRVGHVEDSVMPRAVQSRAITSRAIPPAPMPSRTITSRPTVPVRLTAKQPPQNLRTAPQRPINKTVPASQPRQVIRRPLPVRAAPQLAAYQRPSQPVKAAAPKPLPIARQTEPPKALFRPYLDAAPAPKRALPLQTQTRVNTASRAAPKPSQTPGVKGGSSVPVMSGGAPAQTAENRLKLAGASPRTNTARQTQAQPMPEFILSALKDNQNGNVGVPKILTPQDVPTDPDAPIATVMAAPTTPVEVEPF